MDDLRNTELSDHLIIGGGIAGTTIALSLLKRQSPFFLLESAPRLGGKIQTQLTSEACFEFGPNSFGNQPDDIFKLLETLDLSSEVLAPSSSACHRYILKKGKITRLPGKPQEMLVTRALSLWGRLRFFSEAFFVPQKKKDEESVWDFFTRHFGSEVANYFADPFVSGIFAGDVKNLSLSAAFPTMFEAEAQHSSLIRYLIAQRKTAKASPQSYQLKRGLESIFHNALEKIGPERVRLSEQVTEIAPKGEGLQVVTDQITYETQALYVTTPAYVTATLLKKHFPEISQILAKVVYAPVVTLHLKVSKKEKFLFDGFGILMPSLEKRQILGVLWNSSTFPALFPDQEYHYLTVYVGGVHHQELALSEDAAIQKVVSDEVQNLFGLERPLTILHMRRHPQAIPQYTLGYGTLLRSLQEALSRYPALKLAGNYMGGISLPKTVAHAIQCADSK